jgi:hypothetical protein
VVAAANGTKVKTEIGEARKGRLRIISDSESTFLQSVTKEVNKEQPSYINLSATATRVLQCTCPVAASWKYFSAIHTSTSPHLNSLTLTFVKNIILHLLLVLCTAVNVRNKN